MTGRKDHAPSSVDFSTSQSALPLCKLPQATASSHLGPCHGTWMIKQVQATDADFDGNMHWLSLGVLDARALLGEHCEHGRII